MRRSGRAAMRRCVRRARVRARRSARCCSIICGASWRLRSITWTPAIKSASGSRAISAWQLPGVDENEAKVHAAILFPRSANNGDYGGNVYLSARGGFGQYLRRRTTFTEFQGKLTLEDTGQIISNLLEGLQEAGLVKRVQEPPKKEKDGVAGYQLPAAALIWSFGDGTQVFHDPIRMPRTSSEGQRPNPFFVDFYREMSARLNDLRAYE